MSEDQLRAIEARHHSAQWTLTPSSQISTCHARADIPALVAEVRRLRAQVDAMAGLVEYAYMETNKKWQLNETGKWNEQLEQAFKEMFSVTDAKKKLTGILNGESEGTNGN